MNLVVKLARDLAGVTGNTGIVLCTEDGEMLGPQVSCSLQNTAGDAPLVTFTFRVDGDKVRFAD